MRSLKLAILFAFGLLISTDAIPQSNPGFVQGQQPTAAQWNSYFSAKQDLFPATPLLQTGGFLTGKLTLNPSTTGTAGLNCGAGATPSAPINGDVWCTSAGMFAQINGASVGPFSTGGGGNSPGGSTGNVQTNNGSGGFAGITNTQLTALVNLANASVSGAIPNIPNNTTTVLRGDNSFAQVNYTMEANALANTVVGNPTGGSANKQDMAMPSCSTATSALNWTSGTGFGCNGNSASLVTADQTVSGGANVTSDSLGTQSSGTLTIDCGARPLQFYTNGGAHTLAAPSNDGSCMILVTNNASAGTITFSGFTVGSSTGAPLTTVNSSKFTISIWRIAGLSGYTVFAHQ